jgi:glycosyltransferase involved in cell wall biosynthesis
MRVACISTSKVPGITANAIQLMTTCDALVRIGHDVTLWLPDYGDPMDWGAAVRQYGLHNAFPIRRFPSLPILRRYDFCWRAVQAADDWGADLYYVWALQAAALAAGGGRATILELHDRPTGRVGPWLFQRFLQAPARRRVLVTTHALESYLRRTHDEGLVMALCLYAPNGVDLTRYRSLPAPKAARQALGWPEAFTAVYTGHLYRGRGAPLMFELAERNPDVRFVWAGGQTEHVDHWRRKSESKGLGNLSLIGFVDHQQIPLVQAAGDVLLMPYEEQIEVSGGGDSAPFANPMKAYEYLAAGRPIMSSDLPVIREPLNERNALLLPPRKVDVWQQALSRLRADAELRSRLGARAKRDSQEFGLNERARRVLSGLAPEAADA